MRPSTAKKQTIQSSGKEENKSSFHHFIEHEGDLEGIVAYSYYKRDKLNWAEELKKDGRRASSEEKATFINTALRPDEIKKKKNQAHDWIVKFSYNLFSEIIEKEKNIYLTDNVKSRDECKRYVETKIETLHNAIKTKENKNKILSYLSGVTQSIIATIFLVIFTVLIATIGFGQLTKSFDLVVDHVTDRILKNKRSDTAAP